MAAAAAAVEARAVAAAGAAAVEARAVAASVLAAAGAARGIDEGRTICVNDNRAAPAAAVAAAVTITALS